MIKIFESSEYKDIRYVKLIGHMVVDDARFDDAYHHLLVQEDRRIISIIDCSKVTKFDMAFVKYFAQSSKEYENQFIEGHVFGLAGMHKVFYNAFLTFFPNSSFPIHHWNNVSEVNNYFNFDLYRDFDVLVRSNAP